MVSRVAQLACPRATTHAILCGEHQVDDVDIGDEAAPPDTFSHSDPKAQVAVTASTSDGGNLPEWVSFSATDGKFTGTPPPGVKSLEVVVTARDSTGNEVATTLTLTFD